MRIVLPDAENQNLDRVANHQTPGFETHGGLGEGAGPYARLMSGRGPGSPLVDAFRLAESPVWSEQPLDVYHATGICLRTALQP